MEDVGAPTPAGGGPVHWRGSGHRLSGGHRGAGHRGGGGAGGEAAGGALHPCTLRMSGLVSVNITTASFSLFKLEHHAYLEGIVKRDLSISEPSSTLTIPAPALWFKVSDVT